MCVCASVLFRAYCTPGIVTVLKDSTEFKKKCKPISSSLLPFFCSFFFPFKENEKKWFYAEQRMFNKYIYIFFTFRYLLEFTFLFLQWSISQCMLYKTNTNSLNLSLWNNFPFLMTSTRPPSFNQWRSSQSYYEWFICACYSKEIQILNVDFIKI